MHTPFFETFKNVFEIIFGHQTVIANLSIEAAVTVQTRGYLLINGVFWRLK